MEDILEKQEKMVSGDTIPAHPFMAANNWSNVHCDAYQSDCYTCRGPGNSSNVNRYSLPNEEQNERLISLLVETEKGNLVTVGGWEDSDNRYCHELLLLDKDDLTVLASYDLGTTGNEGGGAYFYMDNENRAVVGVCPNVMRFEISYGNDTTEFIKQGTVEIEVSSLVAFLPDWNGNLWYVGADSTGEALVGVVSNNSEKDIYTKLLTREQICNSFAVDEDGGVFIVSDHAMYRFDYDTFSSSLKSSWREKYDRGAQVKPGQYERGSGTTPTLMNIKGKKYVAIADNASPRMNVVVYRRENELGTNESRHVCEVPVFLPNHGCTENSLIAVNGTLIVENNYGYVPDGVYNQAKETVPGLTRMFVAHLYSPQASHVIWEQNKLSVPSVISKVSIPDQLIYTYTLEVVDKVDHWYFTTILLETGEVQSKVPAGYGSLYNNHYSGITLHPETGDAYVPVIGGIIKITSDKG
jgi:hypothetical protein